MGTVRNAAVGWMAAAVLFAMPGVAMADTAGVFQFVVGDVRVVPESGNMRDARKGGLLNVGDEIETRKGATAQVKMGDGAIVVVQPESRLKVAVFHYAGSEDGSERVVFRLEQGGFRSLTGAIGRTNKSHYLIETPVAHMGVRGTDHESYYFAPGTSDRPGAYNKVNTGITYISTQAGEVVIAPNQVGYVARSTDAPALLPSVPGFFNRAVAPRSARIAQADQPVPGAPAVVQQVVAANGVNLTDPVPVASAPGEATFAGHSERVGATFFGRSTANPAIAPNGAVLANAGGDAAWGVDWGSWLGGAPTVNGALATGSIQFAHSANLTTPAQLAALGAGAVNATYNYLGGPAPTNPAGVQGKVNSLSVGVNFGTQAITSYALSATVDGKSWNAKGNGSIAQFTGASGIALTGTCAGCSPPAPATGANGAANGAFVGGAAEKMITSFGLTSAKVSMSGAAYLGR